jgi:hypothetical protein
MIALTSRDIASSSRYDVDDNLRALLIKSVPGLLIAAGGK